MKDETVNYYLVKSEPAVYSIHDLKRDGCTLWTGVRNYQARNYLRQMEVGDKVFFYHSNDEQIGIIGLALVIEQAQPDPSQFDKGDPYYDPDSIRQSPKWYCPKIAFERLWPQIVALNLLKKTKGLEDLPLIRKGNRLSVMPVGSEQAKIILEMAQ